VRNACKHPRAATHPREPRVYRSAPATSSCSALPSPLPGLPTRAGGSRPPVSRPGLPSAAAAGAPWVGATAGRNVYRLWSSWTSSADSARFQIMTSSMVPNGMNLRLKPVPPKLPPPR